MCSIEDMGSEGRQAQFRDLISMAGNVWIVIGIGWLEEQWWGTKGSERKVQIHFERVCLSCYWKLRVYLNEVLASLPLETRLWLSWWHKYFEGLFIGLLHTEWDVLEGVYENREVCFCAVSNLPRLNSIGLLWVWKE